jgi:DNA repair protein RecO (recombination protein O)
MEERSSGIILRTRPLTESSLIVQWLTPDLGRLSTVAKGARRPKSSFRGQLDVFFSAEFSFQRSRRSELHTLREIKLLETYDSFRTHLEALEQAAYAVALIEQNTEVETPVPEIHELFQGFIRYLTKAEISDANVLAFELKFLEIQGLAPAAEEVSLRPATYATAQTWLESDWAGIASIPVSTEQTRELSRFLHGFLIYHLGRIPKNRPVRK